MKEQAQTLSWNPFFDCESGFRHDSRSIIRDEITGGVSMFLQCWAVGKATTSTRTSEGLSMLNEPRRRLIS